MFPESSTWQADVVRVTADGRRVPVERRGRATAGTSWCRTGGCSYPGVRHHADAGLDNQLAFLEAALDWVAEQHAARPETRYLEATVTTWHNDDPPRVGVLRSHVREGAR